jgi:hypothetical protein
MTHGLFKQSSALRTAIGSSTTWQYMTTYVLGDDFTWRPLVSPWAGDLRHISILGHWAMESVLGVFPDYRLRRRLSIANQQFLKG